MKLQMFEFGNGIVGPSLRWTFEGIADKFERHAEASIPSYELGHQLISKILINATPTHTIYDLGCSTGNLLFRLHDGFAATPQSAPKFVGIDSEKTMVDFARTIAGRKRLGINFHHADIREFDYEPSSAFVVFYTLQFLPLEDRLSVLKRIYRALVPGGITLVFEKVRPDSKIVDETFVELYREFKINNGLTEEQIINKELALKGVMESITRAELESLFSRSGFTSWTPVNQSLFFEGWLLTKSE